MPGASLSLLALEVITFALGAIAGLLGFVLYRYYRALKKAEFVKKVLEERVRHYKYLIITDFLNHYVVEDAVVDSEKITTLEGQEEIKIELAPGALVGDYIFQSEDNPEIAMIYGVLEEQDGKKVLKPVLTASELRDPALRSSIRNILNKLLAVMESLRRAHDEVLDEILNRGIQLLTQVYESANVEKRIQAVAWLVAHNESYFDLFLEAYNEAKGVMLTKPELLKRLSKEPTLRMLVKQIIEELQGGGGE